MEHQTGGSTELCKRVEHEFQVIFNGKEKKCERNTSTIKKDIKTIATQETKTQKIELRRKELKECVGIRKQTEQKRIYKTRYQTL